MYGGVFKLLINIGAVLELTHAKLDSLLHTDTHTQAFNKFKMSGTLTETGREREQNQRQRSSVFLNTISTFGSDFVNKRRAMTLPLLYLIIIITTLRREQGEELRGGNPMLRHPEASCSAAFNKQVWLHISERTPLWM